MGWSFYHKEDLGQIQKRIFFLYPAVIGIFILLLLRVWFLQIIKGDYYKDLSENNRMRTVYLNPQRGLIYDRNGKIVVNNAPGFSLYLVPEDIKNRNDTIKSLGSILEMEPGEIEMQLNTKRNQPSYLPVKIKGNLSMREVAMLEIHKMDLPGIRIGAESQRNYPHGVLAAHLVGYVGEVSSAQLKESGLEDLIPSSIVGHYGAEKRYDSALRGKTGKKIVEVDAVGRETNMLRIDQPTPGDDIYLTIDLDLQKEAEEALGVEAGAIVAMDPDNGEILAMVSHPAFDPNTLSHGVTQAEWEKISRDPGHILMNRAIQGEYPPGSTFKIVVASSALELKDITPASNIYCRGGLYFGNRIFKDWKRGGHGYVDIHRAIVESCDVFFYEIGRKVGVDGISGFARMYGLGEKTGIDLFGERKGLIPTSEWKMRVFGQPWFPGETLSVSIGQGYTTATPLQMANMLSSVVNPDRRFRPHIIKGIRERGSLEIKEFTPEAIDQLNVSPKVLEIIKEALKGVVNEPHGTALRSRSAFFKMAGKTGTAQVVGDKHTKSLGAIPKEFQDHAWFIAYAPAEDPEIAVAVLVEHGGHGGSVSAPIAKRIIERYLKVDEGKDNRGL